MHRIITIGRAPDNDIVLDFPQVSSYHVKFVKDEDGYTLEDLESSNGTYVNGQRILKEHVTFSDTIHFGSLPFNMDNLRDDILSRITGQNPALAKTAIEIAPFIDLKSVVIGRSPDCDIFIDYPQVSGHHVKITPTTEGFQIEDLQSTNGTFVDGMQITSPRLIKSDESIYLGTYKFSLSQLEPAKKRTAFLDTAEIIKFSEKIRLQKDVITIGRESDNDIVLEYPQISEHHAILKQSTEGYIIHDLRSTNGTFVNGHRIESCLIQDSDQIQLGSVVLVLEQGTIKKQDQSRSVRLDVVNATQQAGTKIYLNNVSLSIFPNEFVGLLGPSGAGKSTLLDTIIGIRKATSGHIFINNTNLYENFNIFRQWIGYVPQDDIIHKELTVRQCLYFTAKLRLALDEVDINKRIDEVLEELELTHIQDKQIGGRKEKISGGQRKRVSLAVELLAEPGLLFLDEPTSGLDPRVENLMMKLFRRLADQGRTIVVTTHSMESLDQLDNIVFLSEGGSLAYYGPAKECDSYFGASKASEIFGQLNISDAPTKKSEYENSSYYETYVTKRLRDLAPHKNEPPKIIEKAEGKFIDFKQTGVLLKRNITIKLKDLRNTALLLGQAPIIAILMIIGFNEPNFQLLLMISISAVFFGCINACREIVGERSIFMRERMVNLSIPSYLLAKVVVLAGFCFLQGIILLSIIYTSINMEGNFFSMFGLFFFTAMGSLFLGLTISAIVDSQEKAMTIVPIVLLPQIIFAGALFKLNGLSEYLSYLTICRWSFEAFLELEGLPLQGPLSGLISNNLSNDIIAIALITVILVGCTYFAIKRNDIK
jgi:ABC transport system ATP-binding/permease protein